MSILLIGCRGCGKSTVGRILADKLRFAFLDTDEEIVRRTRRTIREIFEDDGEPAFRALESQLLREVVSLKDHVIALGGGAILRPENRAVMSTAGHEIIYLHCDANTLAHRIASDPETKETRPQLSKLEDAAESQRQLTERHELYRSIMTHEVDATPPPAQVAAAVLGKGDITLSRRPEKE